MCIAFTNREGRNYGDKKICWVPVAPHMLYQVNEFVRDLDVVHSNGKPASEWLLQRMVGRVIGTLGYAAVIVAALVESAAICAIALLALIPSMLFNDGFVHVFSMGIVAVMVVLDTPLRALSGFVQNILFFQDKDYAQLYLIPACIRNSCVPSAEAGERVRSTASERLANP